MYRYFWAGHAENAAEPMLNGEGGINRVDESLKRGIAGSECWRAVQPEKIQLTHS